MHATNAALTDPLRIAEKKADEGALGKQILHLFCELARARVCMCVCVCVCVCVLVSAVVAS